MLYIIVNGRYDPKNPTWCTFCCEAIGKQYLRDLDNRCVYHGTGCLNAHIAHTEQSVARMVS